MFWDSRNYLAAATAEPLGALPTDFAEGWTAAVGSTVAEDLTLSDQAMTWTAWQQVIDQAEEATGQRFANPADMMGRGDRSRPTNQPSDFTAMRADTPEDGLAPYDRRAAELRRQLAALGQSVPTDQDITDRIQAEADRRATRRDQAMAGGGWGAAGAVTGGMATMMIDPPNLLSLGLGAGAGAGFLRKVLTEAALNAGVEATNQISVMDWKQQLGRDYGPGDAAAATALAGAGAGVLSGLGWGANAALTRWRTAKAAGLVTETPETRAAEYDAARQAIVADSAPSPDPAVVERHAVAVDEVMQALERGEHSHLPAIVAEQEQIHAVYQSALDVPFAHPFSTVARLEPDHMQAILFAHGPALERDGEIIVQGADIRRSFGPANSGRGAIKIIVKHGEYSKEGLGNTVSRDDLIRLPVIVRTVEPEITGRGQNRSHRWTIQRADGRRVVYVARQAGHNSGELEVISAFVARPDLEYKYPLSRVRQGVEFEAPARQPRPQGDHAEDGLNGAPEHIIRPVALVGNGPDFRPLPPSLRPPDVPRPVSLTEWLKSRGGLRDAGGELAAMDAQKARPGLISGKGRELDDATLAAWEAGYLPGAERPGINALLDAVRAELKGEKRFASADLERKAAWDSWEARRVAAAEAGVDGRGLSDTAVADAVALHDARKQWDADGNGLPVSDDELRGMVAEADFSGRPLAEVMHDVASARQVLSKAPPSSALADDIPFEFDDLPAAARSAEVDAPAAAVQRLNDARALALQHPERTMPLHLGDDAQGNAIWGEETDIARLFELTDEDDDLLAEVTACVAGTGVPF